MLIVVGWGADRSSHPGLACGAKRKTDIARLAGLVPEGKRVCDEKLRRDSGIRVRG
jgi:hypothetical protein